MNKIGRLILIALGQLPKRRLVGATFGRIALLLTRRRRRIAEQNLQATMPTLSAKQRRQLLQLHFISLGQWLMDSLWALSANRQALCHYIRLEGDIKAPCLLLAPHFIGIDLALLRLSASSSTGFFYYYKPLHNRFWNDLTNQLRQRYGAIGLPTSSRFSLLSGVRGLRAGGILCFLPDIDPRSRKSTVFVPFMGVEKAATTTTISRLAASAKVPVVPVIVCPTEDGYVLRLLPPLADFPGDSKLADAQRINELIKEWIEKQPQHYFWLHRRFKTPAVGETSIYD